MAKYDYGKLQKHACAYIDRVFVCLFVDLVLLCRCQNERVSHVFSFYLFLLLLFIFSFYIDVAVSQHCHKPIKFDLIQLDRIWNHLNKISTHSPISMKFYRWLSEMIVLIRRKFHWKLYYELATMWELLLHTYTLIYTVHTLTALIADGLF